MNSFAKENIVYIYYHPAASYLNGLQPVKAFPRIIHPNAKHQASNQHMEIHKHPHHVANKKKWGEYFLEFFMLFFAVFLGFVAENVRETSVEHEREKQYAQQLYTEFYADSIAFAVSSDQSSFGSVSPSMPAPPTCSKRRRGSTRSEVKEDMARF